MPQERSNGKEIKKTQGRERKPLASPKGRRYVKEGGTGAEGH